MLNQQTLDKMNEMKLSAMAEAFEQQLGSGEHAKLSFRNAWGCWSTASGPPASSAS